MNRPINYQKFLLIGNEKIYPIFSTCFFSPTIGRPINSEKEEAYTLCKEYLVHKDGVDTDELFGDGD